MLKLLYIVINCERPRALRDMSMCVGSKSIAMAANPGGATQLGTASPRPEVRASREISLNFEKARAK